MIQVKHVFNEHKDEINIFYGFLEEIINHSGRLIIDPPMDVIKSIRVETTAVIKASFFLMLYNCVESTVVNCLTTILRTLKDEDCRYAELTDEVQKAILGAYECRVRECENKENLKEYLKQQVDFSTGLTSIEIDLKSLVGSTSQGTFSGSLDAREIRKIFGYIGIDLTSLTCDEMKLIKECRNKLAHGETSFQEYGCNLTLQYLQVSKDSTLTYLDRLINAVDAFLRQKSYRR